MKYIMKAGALYCNDEMKARIKGTLTGPKKMIYSEDGRLLMHTDIISRDAYAAGASSDEASVFEADNVRNHQYVLFDKADSRCAAATPDYAEGDDPYTVGWPVCRMPKVDHAKVDIRGREYLLVMQNSGNYSLSDKSQNTVIQIFHRGLIGGWDIEASEDHTPEMICGIFIFCKYIEQENEFLIV